MKKKNLLKLIVGVSLVAVMAISIPLMSGCAAPAPTPTPTPEPTPEPTPAPAPEPAEELPLYTFRYASVWSPATIPEVIQPIADYAEAMSGGRIQIDMFTISEFGSEEEWVGMVQKRTVDIIDCGGVFGGPSPTAPVDDWIPFAVGSLGELAVLYYERGIRDIIAQAYEGLGDIHYLGNDFWEPDYLITSKPITSYDDFRGLKVSGDPTISSPFIPAGMSPVMLPSEEFYLAGQTGVLDGVLWGGLREYHAMGLDEVYPYVLLPSISGFSMGHVLMNLEAWNSLPPDLQAIMEGACMLMSWNAGLWSLSGDSTDLVYWQATELSKEEFDKVMANAIAAWDELAAFSPEAAQIMAIIRAYNEELEASGKR